MTCGGCYHYRFGRCKNKRASTYGASYPAESEGCQMHLTRWLLPFGVGAEILAVLIGIPLLILSQTGSENSNFSFDSDHDGFEI